ncbi:hypothetical protein B7463_g12319, partial [Scytalidium lignicola]
MGRNNIAFTFLHRIVRNDAIKLDPPEIYNWRVFALAAAACFGGTLFGMDTGIIGGVLTLPDFGKEFNYNNKTDPNLSGNLVTVMQAGAVAGALLANPFAERLGRKPGLLMVSVFAFIGGMLQSFSYGHLSCFYVGRFVEGLGLGGATMLAPTYVSENSPRAIRGLLVGFYQLFETMGAMIAFFIDYGSLLHLKGHASWMVPLAMQSLPPLLIFICIMFCPESPRWLASKDNWEKASETLASVRHLPVSHPYVQAELLELRTQLEEERRSIHGEGFWATQKECWLIKGNRNRALLAIGLMTCQQWTGTNAINYYAPTIFKNLGITGNSQSLLATGPTRWVENGRLCGLASPWASSCITLAFTCDSIPPKPGAPVSGPGYAALVMVYLFAAAFQFGWGPVCWIYVSEIPTNRLRGYTVSLAAATQWVFNLVVAKVTPIMLVHVGGKTGYGTYFLFGSFCFGMAIAAFWIPETKGLSLERMDELFGDADFSGIEDVGLAGQEKGIGGITETSHVEKV